MVFERIFFASSLGCFSHHCRETTEATIQAGFYLKIFETF